MLTPPSYVLITPARNEAEFLELTIKSVVAQTLRPVKWIIVSDGSTDGTNEIVRKYTAAHPWIELVEMPEREERHFAGKALAVNTGYEKLVETQYDVIGNLDADVSFEPGLLRVSHGSLRGERGVGSGGHRVSRRELELQL